MLKIRKNDTVLVLKGKDKGKKGRVLQVFTARSRALVEGINMVKKHKRQTSQNQQGGIISIESPISVSNLMYFCKGCNKGVRVGFSPVKNKDEKSKTRFCKLCKEAI